MPPQSKRKKAPESPEKVENKKSKRAEAPAPPEDKPQDGSLSSLGFPGSLDDPNSEISKFAAWFESLLRSLRDECITKSPYFKRTPDLLAVRPGIKIMEEVVIPDVWCLAGAFVGNPHLIDQLGRVCHLEKDLAELKESTGREKQALFDELVEVALAKERATHGNNQSDGK